MEIKTQESIKRAITQRLFASLKQSSEKKRMKCKLTVKEFEDFINDTPDVCYYCGMTLNEYVKIRNFICNYDGDNWEINRYKKFFKSPIHRRIERMTIDRKYNDDGYGINNIVKSCWICNSIKGDFFSSQEMKEMAKNLISYLKISMIKYLYLKEK